MNVQESERWRSDRGCTGHAIAYQEDMVRLDFLGGHGTNDESGLVRWGERVLVRQTVFAWGCIARDKVRHGEVRLFEQCWTVSDLELIQSVIASS